MRYLRFTIRDLLALTFVAALGVMVFTSMRQRNLAQQELMSLESQLQGYQSMLYVLQIQTRFAESELAWLEAKAVALQSVSGHIANLQEKYATLEETDPGTVSVRSVPTMVDEDYQGGSWRMRVLVPEQGEVFLKCGVAPEQYGMGVPGNVAWQQKSALDYSGPYEIKLPPGLHDIDVARGVKGQNEIEGFKLSIDYEPVLITTFRKPGVSTLSRSALSADKPYRFPVGSVQDLVQWNFGTGQQGSTRSMLYIWLDGVSSRFDSFPMAEEDSEDLP